MQTRLAIGMRHEEQLTVSPEMLAARVGSGLVEVFSTAMMIAWMERTAVAAVQAALPEGLTTVGTGVDVRHLAATPVGMEVCFGAELVGISANGKGLTFRVEAHDAAGLIGEGTHQRVIVDKARFEARTAAKNAARGQAAV
ncbi:MAG: thioesterase family protein [Desulfovibrio sp.]|nr:thioesterase family protein [Desulfovibrio sp.]